MVKNILGGSSFQHSSMLLLRAILRLKPLGVKNKSYSIFRVYLVDGYFEIGSGFLDGYFLNEPVPWTS